jgi:hypothetical protein
MGWRNIARREVDNLGLMAKNETAQSQAFNSN